MKKQRIRLLLRSYDHQLLDKAVKQIVLTVKRTGSNLVGPIPLPNMKRVFTVLRSPHIDKKSREQFELTTHKADFTSSIEISSPPKYLSAISSLKSHALSIILVRNS